jgi:signal transducing adaptor molecule
MTQLNERFIKARRDYESLLEASMSQPPQQSYGRPAYSYGAPPSHQSYGAPPPQQAGGYGGAGGGGYQPAPDPRFQSPPPQSEPQYPPQNGPQPFYFVPPDQQVNQPPPRAQSTTHPAPAAVSTDDLYTQPARTNVNDPRRQTIAFGQGANQIGIPQELATGSFDSPVNSVHNPPPQSAYDAYAVQHGKASAPSDPYGAPLSQNEGYTQGSARPPVPGGLASLPSQQGLAPTSTSPVYGNNPYGQAAGGGGAGGGYTAYNPSAVSLASPAAAGGPGSGYPRTAAGAGGGDESYYQ